VVFHPDGLIMAFTFTPVEMCEVALAVAGKCHSEPVGNGHIDMSEMFTPMQRANDESIQEESQPIDSTAD
jgi:hypothetical protein